MPTSLSFCHLILSGEKEDKLKNKFLERCLTSLSIVEKMHLNCISMAIIAVSLSARKSGLETKANFPFKSKADWLHLFALHGICEHNSRKVTIRWEI